MPATDWEQAQADELADLANDIFTSNLLRYFASVIQKDSFCIFPNKFVINQQQKEKFEYSHAFELADLTIYIFTSKNF